MTIQGKGKVKSKNKKTGPLHIDTQLYQHIYPQDKVFNIYILHTFFWRQKFNINDIRLATTKDFMLKHLHYWIHLSTLESCPPNYYSTFRYAIR